MNFIELIQNKKFILTEGSVIEQIKRKFLYPLHPQLLNSLMVYDPKGREILSELFHSYWGIASHYSLPFIFLTPTWKANKENIEKYADNFNVLSDNVNFCKLLREKIKENPLIFLGGLSGPKNDAYNPSLSLNENEAYEFHKWQIFEMAKCGVDFLITSTLPSLKEAKGIARLYSEIQLPAFISFVIDRNGLLLDGNRLADAIKIIEEINKNKNIFYFVNCVHPLIAYRAFINSDNDINYLKEKIIGVQGNSSMKDPKELDNSPVLEQDTIDKWEAGILGLKEFGLHIFGGCCGTNEQHLEAIARNISD